MFAFSAVGTAATCAVIVPVPPFALNVTVWLTPVAVTESSVTVTPGSMLQMLTAAAMAV